MRGERRYNRRQSQFHEYLQRQETTECVVVALYFGREIMQHEYRSERTDGPLDHFGEQSGKDGTIAKNILEHLGFLIRVSLAAGVFPG